ncbi:MAG: MarR family EPS-associated transcriptional regulator, partial [Candidatus Omnitrophica bacterium]|nr:MarR family EPS-associated transcriptional regulator [Candidatus Omnitrophota bacterium]
MKHIKETIKLLDHIEQNPESTQRELVEKLDVSLGKVNFLIKALAEAEIIKLKRFKNSKNKTAYLYLITPKGIAKKANITGEFLKYKIEEYDALKQEIKTLKLKIHSGKNRRKQQPSNDLSEAQKTGMNEYFYKADVI